ncbi:MAG TPA: helix-turn-helix domain-containing protein [Holophagaceae bacterium]|jgi:hypothetical protein|nr:helix-turn-helix domain-containing protein [Holophagaceae bacterium]
MNTRPSPELGQDLEPGFFTTPQAARFIGLSARYLEILRRQGGGPRYVRISSRRCLYARAELVAWMQARTFRHLGEEGA